MKRAILAAIVAAIPVLACGAEGSGAPAAAAPEITTDEQKTLYALGLVISRNVAPFGLSEADLALVEAGLADGVLGRTPKADLQVFGPKIQELARTRLTAQAAAEKTAGADFLTKAAAEPGAVKTPSGVIYKEVSAGTGESPKPSDRVKVNYAGSLRDGKVFDSSQKRGQPLELVLNQFIPCWSEGLQKMKVGGKAHLVCPAESAYGDRGSPPDIKPGAALAFDIELLEIVKTPPPAPPAPPVKNP
jgi:FKBP-type peptidyl-prolyl cis-trans isomerase FkpA